MPKSPFSPFKALPPRAPSVAIDRLGKLIEPGHLILFHNEEDLIFEVADVRPVLNPGLPQGTQAMKVMLRTPEDFPVVFLAAERNRAMVILGESKARIEAKAGANGQVQEAPVEPLGIVLTDAPEPVQERDTVAGVMVDEEAVVGSGVCPACDHHGPVGLPCTACGDATYRPTEA